VDVFCSAQHAGCMSDVYVCLYICTRIGVAHSLLNVILDSLQGD
jgi:hypothetical protein